MNTLRVLLIERDRDRARRLQQTLEHSPLARFRLDHADSTGSMAQGDADDVPDVVVLDVRGADGAAGRWVEEVRRTFPASALVVVGDGEDDPGGSGPVTESFGYVVAAHEERVLDRVAIAAAAVNRRMLELQRRVRDLEIAERNLRTLVATTSDGIMIVDGDGRICFTNPAAERLFDRTSAELAGEAFGFPLMADDTTLIDIRRRDGETCVVELRVSRTRWEGRPARLAALRDITERVKAEQRDLDLVREHTRRMAAEQSERRARILSDATRLLASTLDGNRALSELADLVVPTLADCCIIDVVEPDAAFSRVAVAGRGDAASLLEQMRQGRPRFDTSERLAAAFRRGEPWTAADCSHPDFLAALGLPDDEILMPEGSAHGMVLPLIARDEPLGAMLLIHFGDREPLSGPDLMLVREIAQRAAVAIDHSRLYQKAQDAAQAKADFLAVMSHELRTPLNAIIGYAELLTIGVPAPMPDECREQVGRIRASAGHLLRLINEILSFSSLEDGRVELSLQAADLRSIVSDALAILQSLADRKDLAFRASMPDEPVLLETDPHKLKQILLNIVGNAIKFTDHGSIAISLHQEMQDVVISVRDTGCGISAEDLDRIFHPFWQAEHSRTRRADGTGLGLTLARRLAHLLAGDITVESSLHEGSVFTLRLPWRYPHNRQRAASR